MCHTFVYSCHSPLLYLPGDVPSDGRIHVHLKWFGKVMTHARSVAHFAVAGAGALSTALAVRRARRAVHLVVLGQRTVGKTRLINSWRGDWSPTRATHVPEKITPITFKTGEKMFRIDKRSYSRRCRT